MITFALHGYEGVDPAGEFGPLQAEFERQGFACRIIRSPKRPTKTPNQDRAKAMIEALRDVEGEVALEGISNQGLMLPLVAAARPVRRIVLINAVIPHPGQSFLEGSKRQRVWANWIVRMIARRAPGMNEVSPLTELPKVEYVYICGENDDSISPEWEQWAAREYLHVEPVVVKRASHASIVLPPYASQVVVAATQGLQANEVPTTEQEATGSATWRDAGHFETGPLATATRQSVELAGELPDQRPGPIDHVLLHPSARHQRHRGACARLVHSRRLDPRLLPVAAPS
jgi:hypothetical protein